MATAKELLVAELLRRQQSQQAYDDKTRKMVSDQEDIARIDPGYRTNLQPQAAFIDELTGSNLARAIPKQEDSYTALRRALASRQQMPRDKASTMLTALKGNEASQMRGDKEAQRMREAAAKSKEGQAILKDRALQRSVNDYQELVNKHGFQVTGAKRAEIDRAYRDLQISYKNAAELGVIAGPDMMLIEGVAPPSTGFGSFFQSRIKGGQEGINKALDGLKKSRQDNIESNKQILNSVFAAPSTQQALGSLYGENEKQGMPKQYNIEDITDTSKYKGQSDDDLKAELDEINKILRGN